MEQTSNEGSQVDWVRQPRRKTYAISTDRNNKQQRTIMILSPGIFVKPLVCGHAVVLCENTSGQPWEEQTTDYPPIATQHGCNQQDGSSTQ